MRSIAIAMLALLSGCATTLDPNYALQLDAYRLTISSQQSVEVAKARAEEARYNAMASIATSADPQSKQMALLALALARGGSGGELRQVNVALPQAPETQEDRALKWAAIFAGPLTSVAQGYFGYRLGVTQSNNTAASTIASYNSMGLIATGGFASNQNIANAGFHSNTAIAGGAFHTINGIIDTLPQLQPNITLSGSGIVGSGTYYGPNSGANSGNSGQIGAVNHNGSPSVTCTATTDAGGSAAPGC
jgi:hypothetical protein